MVWNEQLKREIPEGWRAGVSGQLIEAVRTGLNPRQNFSLVTTGIAYLTVKNIDLQGMLDLKNCDFIDEAARAKVQRRSDLRVGDILFASILPLQRCFLIQEEPEFWNINESVFSVRPSSETTSEYLYSYLMSTHFTRQAEQNSSGSIFKGIRHETLKNMSTVIPPIEIARNFTNLTQQSMKMRFENWKENQLLHELRDWLLPMLMNGQATISSESTKLSFT